MTRKIAFGGLGGMGRGVVKNIALKDGDVTAFDLDGKKVEEAIGFGAKPGATPMEMAQDCDVAAFCEGFALAAREGLDMSIVIGIISAADGKSGMMDLYGEKTLKRDFTPHMSWQMRKRMCAIMPSGCQKLACPVYGGFGSSNLCTSLNHGA